MGQLGFYDLDKRLEAISAKGDPLEALNVIVAFESFRSEIEAVVRLAPEERKSNAGREPFASRLHDMGKGTTKAKWEFPPKPSRMRWKTTGRWALGVMSRFGIKV